MRPYYSADDVRRVGLAMVLLTIVVVSVTILYWGGLRVDQFEKTRFRAVTHGRR
jgi:hypothetical protein